MASGDGVPTGKGPQVVVSLNLAIATVLGGAALILGAGYTVGLNIGERNQAIYEQLHKAGIEKTLIDMNAAADRLEKDLRVLAENEKLKEEVATVTEKLKQFDDLQDRYNQTKTVLDKLVANERDINLRPNQAESVSAYFPGALLGVTRIYPAEVEFRLNGEVKTWAVGEKAALGTDSLGRRCELALKAVDYVRSLTRFTVSCFQP